LVLPVGGIKEKCIAAHRNGIRNVILPEKNKKDTEDIPIDVRNQIKFYYATKV
jgi:ATP-dependent Lon protease